MTTKPFNKRKLLAAMRKAEQTLTLSDASTIKIYVRLSRAYGRRRYMLCYDHIGNSGIYMAQGHVINFDATQNELWVKPTDGFIRIYENHRELCNATRQVRVYARNVAKTFGTVIEHPYKARPGYETYKLSV